MGTTCCTTPPAASPRWTSASCPPPPRGESFQPPPPLRAHFCDQPFKAGKYTGHDCLLTLLVSLLRASLAALSFAAEHRTATSLAAGPRVRPRRSTCSERMTTPRRTSLRMPSWSTRCEAARLPTAFTRVLAQQR